MLIKLSNINKTYKTLLGVTYRALAGVTTSFESSGLVFLVGRSGSGKTTLMNIIGGLDNFDSGAMTIAGEPARSMSQSKIDSFRNTVCGYIFQDFNLIETLNVFDNIRIALQMQGNQDTKRVREILGEVGMSDKAYSKVKNLSGGQRQRVAIARALIKEPKIILADEPTGALDTATGEDVMKMLKKLSANKLVLVVSHDMEKAYEYGDRIIELKDGKIYRDVRKRLEGEVFEESDGVSFYSDSLIKIEKNHSFTDTDIDKINEAIMLRGQKTFINIDDNRNKIKALFPNMREAIEQDEVIVKKRDAVSSPSPFDVVPTIVDSFGMQVNNSAVLTNSERVVSAEGAVSAMGAGSSASSSNVSGSGTAAKPTNVAADIAVEQDIEDDKFVPYKPKETTTEKITYKRSRVPISRTLQLGLNYLNHKKVMLVFSIILAVVSFVLLAFAQSIAYFNIGDAIAGTVRAEKYPSVSIKYGAGEQIKQFDIDQLEKAYPKMSFHRQYDMRMNLTGRDNKGIDMRGFVEVEDFSALKLEMLFGEGKAIGKNEIIITEYAANKLLRDWSAPSGVEDIQDIVGRYLSFQGKDVKVVGICKNKVCNDRSYEQQEYTGLMRVYVWEGFLDEIVAESPLAIENSNIKVDGKLVGNNLSIEKMFLLNDSMTDKVNSVGITNGGALGTVNEIYISRGLADNSHLSDLQLATAEDINRFNSSKTELNLGGRALPVFVSRDVQIKGIIEDNSNESYIVVSNSYREQFGNLLISSPLLLATFEQPGQAGSFVNHAYASGFVVDDFYVSDYMTVQIGLEIVSMLLVGLTAILAMLVVILLYNFISTSIQLTKKQIGILRALGARKIDTFLIYVMEGLMVMLFSFVLASVIILIAAPILNAVISAEIGYFFSLFNIGIFAYLAIFALSLAITLLSVAINIKKFNKITPVEAINSK